MRLNPRQNQVFRHPARFRVLVAGRRFGKTELALAEMLRAADAAPNRLVWYVAPSEGEAERIMWHRLKHATGMFHGATPSEKHHRVTLHNGSVIVVKSGFKPDNLRGEGLDFVALDEVADLKPELWERVLRPSLADRKGRALFIGTPKGRNHLFDYFEREKTNPDWASFHFSTEDGGIVDADELENAGRDLDIDVFRQEFHAEFTSIGKHRVYVAFDRAVNVARTDFVNSLPLIWSLDFNVAPMCMLMMQLVTDEIHVLEELIIPKEATTEKACVLALDRIQHYAQETDFKYRPMYLDVHGDASGNQRHTSGSGTDWTQIRDFYFRHTQDCSIRTWIASSNPLVRDRVNCVNARLRNAHGDVRLFIDPKCKELIRDLEEVSWAVDSNGSPTREIDKSDPKRTHMADALGYAVARLFPLRVPGQC